MLKSETQKSVVITPPVSESPDEDLNVDAVAATAADPATTGATAGATPLARNLNNFCTFALVLIFLKS
jgi:hypothetical protein